MNKAIKSNMANGNTSINIKGVNVFICITSIKWLIKQKMESAIKKIVRV